MNAKSKVFQKWLGIFGVCLGCILAVLPFTGIMAKDGPAYDVAMICLGMFFMAIGIWCIDRVRLEVLQNLLDTPLRVPVLLRLRNESRHLLGVVCIDRRTGAIFAPFDAEERVLKWVDLYNVTYPVLRAPYFSQSPIQGSDILYMLNDLYRVPPKS